MDGHASVCEANVCRLYVITIRLRSAKSLLSEIHHDDWVLRETVN